MKIRREKKIKKFRGPVQEVHALLQKRGQRKMEGRELLANFLNFEIKFEGTDRG